MPRFSPVSLELPFFLGGGARRTTQKRQTILGKEGANSPENEEVLNPTGLVSVPLQFRSGPQNAGKNTCRCRPEGTDVHDLRELTELQSDQLPTTTLVTSLPSLVILKRRESIGLSGARCQSLVRQRPRCVLHCGAAKQTALKVICCILGGLKGKRGRCTF